MSSVVLAGCFSGPPDHGASKPALAIHAETWSDGNLSITIVAISADPNLIPANLPYLIQDSGGTTLFAGAAGTGLAVSGATVTVAYHDKANAGRVSVEDNIGITVSPPNSTAVFGASFKILDRGDVLGFTTLP